MMSFYKTINIGEASCGTQLSLKIIEESDVEKKNDVRVRWNRDCTNVRSRKNAKNRKPPIDIYFIYKLLTVLSERSCAGVSVEEIVNTIHL